MDGVENRLLSEVSESEEAFGFGVAEARSGVRAVVRDLGPGLRAVKVRANNGSTEYAICDENLRPIYPPARTLDELRRRFPHVP